MYGQNFKQYKEKFNKKCRICVDSVLFCVYIAFFVLIIIWLFKLNKNAKNEPKNRNRYITVEPSNYYSEGDFCYDKYENFIVKGAFDSFNLKIKKIKKFSTAVISTIFISIGSMFFIIIFFFLCKNSDTKFYIFSLLYCFLIISFILTLAFSIVLAHYYFDCNFRDFEDFSKCKYLTKNFRKDYNFIFKIKNDFKMPFVLILITEFFNFVKLVIESPVNDED